MINYTPQNQLTLEGFTHPFDPSLFVDIRKQLVVDEFDKFNKLIIEKAEQLKPRHI